MIAIQFRIEFMEVRYATENDAHFGITLMVQILSHGTLKYEQKPIDWKIKRKLDFAS